MVLQAPGLSAVGFAVAGGRSRRMGRDKALLSWSGTDLLGHALGRLRTVTADVRILAGSEARHAERGVAIETDSAPGLGPMAGLLAALEAAPGCTALLLAIDLPLVPAGLLARLLDLAADADAVVPVSGQGPEPLCAAYGPGCLAPARRAIVRGDLKMTAFWPEVRVRTMPPEELVPFGSLDTLFLNVNAPDDYERALALRGGGIGS